MKGTAIYHSPVGDMWLEYEDGAVTALKNAVAGAKGDAPNELTERVFRQLDEYFAGTRRTFDFPYRLRGTPFQEKVWAALRQIPYGETRSYKDIAQAVGRPKAFRAVGMANHANPIFIVIPCHRVIGTDGRLVGYGGGLDMKKALLDLERSHNK
ncbi:MAG: methylated-DNA--[protein]-cysteine S-methyltransferase [Gemmiger sp.]